jgi:hypothetical protein
MTQVTPLPRKIMASDDIRDIDSEDTGDTARIDRRQTVLAQIEAALLANKLSVLDFDEERAGSDPYNRSRARSAAVWDTRRKR